MPRARVAPANVLAVAVTAVVAFAAVSAKPCVAHAQPAPATMLTQGRFTFVAQPADLGLARNLLAYAVANDSFPGLRRPRAAVRVVIAHDDATFRELLGGQVPEWGIAVAIPDDATIVMQGQGATARAGDHRTTLRHEIAHLALHEVLGPLPPRWFDEGYASYAAGEWGREQVLASSLALAFRGTPRLAALDTLIAGGSVRAERGYALAHRAVADLAARDPARGLTLLFDYWTATRSLDAAVRRAYGTSLVSFEEEWRRATRRRYGFLAVVADIGFAAGVLFVVVAPLWIVRRRRDRARLAALIAAEAAAAKRERESALEALLAAGSGGADGPAGGPPPRPESPEGRDGTIRPE